METVTTLSIIVLISTCLKETLVSRKVFFAPIYALVNEALWICLIIFGVPAAWPILLASTYYIIVYSLAIPKWLRERNTSKLPNHG